MIGESNTSRETKQLHIQAQPKNENSERHYFKSDIPAYKNESFYFGERAKDLVFRMTLDEKVSQLLRILVIGNQMKLYSFTSEMLRGVQN